MLKETVRTPAKLQRGRFGYTVCSVHDALAHCSFSSSGLKYRGINSACGYNVIRFDGDIYVRPDTYADSTDHDWLPLSEYADVSSDVYRQDPELAEFLTSYNYHFC